MRFESDLPNETWQSDMTHWHLVDDEPVTVEVAYLLVATLFWRFQSRQMRR